MTAATDSGSIGCWSVEWRALGLLIDASRRQPERGRLLTAFPAVANAASNGVCGRNGLLSAQSAPGAPEG